MDKRIVNLVKEISKKFPMIGLVSFYLFDMSWIMSFRGKGVSLQLGIMATGIAYLFFAKGLIHVSSSTAVILSLAEPLTAALLGVLIVGEYLTITSWTGILLLIIGIGL